MAKETYVPTPEEIAEACLEIREEWTEQQWIERSMQPNYSACNSYKLNINKYPSDSRAWPATRRKDSMLR